MDNPEYESILSLLREIHKNPNPSTSNQPQSDEETDGLERNQSLLNIDIENPQSRSRKRSIFDTKLKIPMLTITGSHFAGIGSSGISSPETSELGEHRKFSFAGHFRRHSHVESMSSLTFRTLNSHIDNDDFAAFKSFLESHQTQVDDRDENGTTALMVASSKGLVSYVKELLLNGADVNTQDLDNWTALLNASKGGYLEIVEILIENGADIEHKDMGNFSALCWACYKGHHQIVSYLLDRNADIHVNGNYHISALVWACGRGYTEIAQMLIQRGAKVNVGDKYGTSALVWASRKGHTEIVDMLLKAGANVDTAGMYSWTPILVAAMGGHQDVVSLLLDRKPNINCLDKDGSTALAIACKEGHQEIAANLIAAGAYLNSQDKNGDTPLINAVKGNHRAIVENLIKKHVDIDLQGKDRKTALYIAVEKGHVSIVKMLLMASGDLELATKDGETPLHRAVRSRNLEIVHLLLDKRAKVGAVDRRGDNCLHIAMRARSKAIVEALLRNPKNSQLLYRPNKANETPYALDALHQKTILGQVFGARKLNTNEDSEGMLGYELYSSALADVLSEPTLTAPIAVGLFAKWGSGKSFLLTKLKEEMSSFWQNETPINASWIHILIALHIAIIFGVVIGVFTTFLWGLLAAVSFCFSLYIISLILRVLDNKYNFDWIYNMNHAMMKKIGKFRLILQVAFCHPPGASYLRQSNSQAAPVRFHFAEINSAASTGEYAVGYMIASLFNAIENYYGSIPTRLYRAFRPKPQKPSSGWRFRRMCCLPIFVLFEIFIFSTFAGLSLLVLLLSGRDIDSKKTLEFSLYFLGGILLAGAFVNLNAWAKMLNTIFFSQRRYLKRIMKSNEGLTALSAEVNILCEMVICLDAFTGQQSRLVGVIDILDSCDTERTLNILNAIQTLLLSPNRPFVLLIAVDPHVVAKAAEANSKRLFTEGGIAGHDFLRNLVHLPVYLQNSGLRKVQRAQNTAMIVNKKLFPEHQYDIENNTNAGGLTHSASSRRLSTASEIMSSTEKLRAPRGSKKMKLSESVASSIGSNLHKLGGGGGGAHYDRMMLTDDYFSDANPRFIRRLMNVIYITVRLLKAFQIEFSWYRLSSWINLTEQWPLRASMIVLEHDLAGDSLDDTASLQSLYEKVRAKIPNLRESAALLDLDRDERKLDAFLQLHKGDLQVLDLRIFLPFTINLDPYLRKVLKEDQQAMEDDGIVLPIHVPQIKPPIIQRPPQQITYVQNSIQKSIANYSPTPTFHHHQPSASIPIQQSYHQQQEIEPQPLASPSFAEMELGSVPLSRLSCDDLINILSKINELKGIIVQLTESFNENAITGRVLMHCDLNELKSVLKLNFGHWEILKLLILNLRTAASFKPTIPQITNEHKEYIDSTPQTVVTQVPRKQKSVIEKQKNQHHYDTDYLQVTMEEQLICGALQTLNEDAFEDVANNEHPNPTGIIIKSRPSSPVRQQKTILKHQNSVKNSDKSRKVSLEVMNEKSGKPPIPTTKSLFHMGASFDEKSDEDEELQPLNVPLMKRK